MISKLRATGGAGFDLAQPSQDRIVGAQQEFRIYKPIDLSKVKLEQFMPELLEIVEEERHRRRQALRACPTSGAPRGCVVNTKRAKIADYTDLCQPGPQGQDRGAPASARR